MTESYRDWIGRREGPRRDIVTPRLVQAFRATFEPVLSDTGAGPIGLHWCLCPDMVAEKDLGADGHPARGGFLPPVALPRRMWAGGTLEIIAPLAEGAEIERTSRIDSITEKTGTSGPLVFVTVRHSYSSSGSLAVRETHDIVYRTAVSGPQPAPTVSQSAEVDETMSFDVTAVTLFRYSALTFNGHRIHYDTPYVQNVESIPGLLIHGPLQATLLLNFAARIKGAPPVRFRYRGRAPATGPQSLTLTATRSEDGLALSVLSQDGVTTMTAEAAWE